MQQVVIELFGIARARAGVAQTTANGKCLGDVLADLSQRFPGLANHCINGRSLRPGFLANLGGKRFVTDQETPISDGDVILLMPVDAGG